MLIGGNNIGRIGNLQSLEKHPGSFEIAHVKDVRGQTFATRLQNILVIGDGKTPAISIPKGEGIRLTLVQERDARLGEEAEEADEDDE
jgi:small subunit ribosomal protein S4e